jgi:hypothetical protein
MKGVIALLFLLSVALSLKAHSANHEAPSPPGLTPTPGTTLADANTTSFGPEP